MAGMTPEDTPATKNDLLALEERLVERMRDMQSEIIRVFMEFQERNEIRYGARGKRGQTHFSGRTRKNASVPFTSCDLRQRCRPGFLIVVKAEREVSPPRPLQLPVRADLLL